MLAGEFRNTAKQSINDMVHVRTCMYLLYKYMYITLYTYIIIIIVCDIHVHVHVPSIQVHTCISHYTIIIICNCVLHFMCVSLSLKKNLTQLFDQKLFTTKLRDFHFYK